MAATATPPTTNSTRPKHNRPQRDFKAEDEAILRGLDIAAEFQSLGARLAGQADGDGWIPAREMGREDRNPSAALNIRTGKWVGHASGDRYSLYDFAAKFGPFADWKEAKRHFAEKAGVTLAGGGKHVGNGKQEGAFLKSIRFDKANPQPVDLWRLWCAIHKPPITVEALKAVDARNATHCERNVIAVPITETSGSEARTCGYVLMPNGKFELPIFGDGKITSYKKIKTAPGSKSGIIASTADIEALKNTELRKSIEVVVKLEGLPDLLTFLSIRPPELAGKVVAFTNSGGCQEDPSKYVELVRGIRLVVVFADADTDGQKGGRKHANAFARVADKVVMPELPYEIEEKHGKDLRDYANDGHGYADLMALAEEAERVLPGPGDPDEKPGRDKKKRGDDSDPSHYRLAEVFLEGTSVDNVSRFMRLGKSFYEWQGSGYVEIEPEEFEDAVWPWLEKNDIPSKHSEVSSIAKAARSQIRAPRGTDHSSMAFWRGTPPPEYPPDVDPENLIVTRSKIIVPTESYLPSEWLELPLTPRLFTRGGQDFDFGHFDDGRLNYGECTQWLKFLREIFDDEQDQIQLLQEWMGYILTNQTRQQKFLLISGPKRSGKGIIVKTMAGIVGRHNTASAMLSTLSGDFGLSPLVGKRLAILAEERKLPKNESLKVLPRILSITGEDVVPVQRKHKGQLDCRLKTRLVILSNDVSPLHDDAGALMSRMLLLRTRNTWDGREDVLLERKIMNELPGILGWAMCGMARVLNEPGFRLRSPESTQADLDGITADSNPLSGYLDAYIEVDPEGWLSTSDFMLGVKCWARDEDIPILEGMSAKKAVDLLTKAIPAARRHRESDPPRRWGYKGIRFSEVGQAAVNLGRQARDDAKRNRGEHPERKDWS